MMSYMESKWWHYVMSEAEADSHLNLFPPSILDIYKVFEHIDMLSIGIRQQPYTVILPTLLGSDFGDLGHLWSQMMSLRHVWGWQPPQTASRIHIWHIQSVWAHSYAVHRRRVAALHSYIHPTWLRLWESGSLVQPKWWHNVMSEADPSHLKLLPASILDIYKVFDHIDIDMRSIGIRKQPYSVILPTLLDSDFGVLGHLSNRNDVITSHLRLTATSNCFPHPY